MSQGLVTRNDLAGLYPLEIGRIEQFKFIQTRPTVDVIPAKPKRSTISKFANRLSIDGRNITEADALRMAQAQAKRDRKNAKRLKDVAK